MQSITRLLAAAGALPFIACAGLQAAGITQIPILGSPAEVAAAYGLAIACFMAGANWGTALTGETGMATNLFLVSNVIAVSAWLVFLVGGSVPTFLCLAALFLYLLYIDWRLRSHGLLAEHYWHTRCAVTAVVVLALSSLAATAVA